MRYFCWISLFLSGCSNEPAPDFRGVIVERYGSVHGDHYATVRKASGETVAIHIPNSLLVIAPGDPRTLPAKLRAGDRVSVWLPAFGGTHDRALVVQRIRLD